MEAQIRTPMSDGDLRRILGADLKIVRYSNLAHANTLEELLPRNPDHLILLFETEPNVGHWTALLRYGNLFEFFDPYGMMPDKELLWIPAQRRKMLNQDEPYLSHLLDKADRWIYNKTRYEKMNAKVNTCGRPLLPPHLPPDPQRHGPARLQRLHGPPQGGVRPQLRRNRGGIRGGLRRALIFISPYDITL